MEKTEESFCSAAISQIGEIKTAQPELQEILEFYESILNTQEKVRRSFKPVLIVMDAGSYEERNAAGLPLLRSEDIEIEQSLLYEILQDICRIIRKHKEDAIPSTLDVPSLSNQHRKLIKGLMEDEVVLERLAQEVKIDYDVFCILVGHSLSPFISFYAEKLTAFIDSSKWLRGYCPVCGREPLMAKLEEDIGSRLLLCSLCHTEWLYKRLACPFCENVDQESLRYFFIEDDEAHRVDLCDKCKRYIKTVDSRKTSSIKNLFTENLSTLTLDIIANKEGFHRNTSLISQ